ncbi:MAG: SLC13 family permease [Planctomycetota bacterium]|nr:SLC13 family permease [Planctomycetota bacterium]MDA1162514.1 SLC13 family permease [Planctomycetota bacterium]
MDASATWTITTLCTGMLIVIGGILVLRLHAFLALTLAALTVAFMTPREIVERSLIEQVARPIAAVELGPEIAQSTQSAHGPVWLRILTVRPGTRQPPEQSQVLRREGNSLIKIGWFIYYSNTHISDQEGPEGVENGRTTQVGRYFYIGPQRLPQPGDLLVPESSMAEIVSTSKQTIANRVVNGFGSTAGKIGILIAMASIIGKCLLDSGAADRIVRAALAKFGEKFAPLSFVLSGFLLGVPVFFDTVFYLMIPLGKAMQLRTGRNYLLFVLTIVAGATMAHSLVPPTPGPLVVAEELGVDIGVMILAGCIVGFFTAGFGYLYASMFANRMWTLPLRETPDFSMKDLEELSNRQESELPPFWLSIIPIGLPVVLIAGYSVIKALTKAEVLTLSAPVNSILATLGDKNIALIISAVIAMSTLIWSRRLSRKDLADAVGSALAGGGIIILITSAGGAFGSTLQATGVANLIQDLSVTSPAMIITMAWLITAAIRTAQGSATVAMMTAVGILGGLAQSGSLPFHPVYLALAIGCGSKPIAWMNDSGFWVITRMSGMTEGEGLKYITPMTTLMGVVGLVVTIAGALLFPMV